MKKTNTTAILAVMAVFLFFSADAHGVSAAGLGLGGSDLVTWKSYAIAISLMTVSVLFFVFSAVSARSKRS